MPALPAPGEASRSGRPPTLRVAIAARSTGRGRCRASEIPGRACSSSAWPRPLTGATARDGCSRATGAGTGSFARSTRPASPISPHRSTRATASGSPAPTSRRPLRCAPPANKPLPVEMRRCQPYLLEELALLKDVRVVVALGKIGWDAYLRARRAAGPALAASASALRPCRPRGHARRHGAARLLPPEPAEHLHGEADAAHAAARVFAGRPPVR